MRSEVKIAVAMPLEKSESNTCNLSWLQLDTGVFVVFSCSVDCLSHAVRLAGAKTEACTGCLEAK